MEWSDPLHKPVEHTLLAGAVEIDRQLVAFDAGDGAIAEFLVEDAVAEGESQAQPQPLLQMTKRRFDPTRKSA